MGDFDDASGVMAPRGLNVVRFSTHGLNPREGHDAWRNQNWPSLAPVLDSTPEPGFTAESEAVQLGPFAVIYGQYGAQTVGRTSERRRVAPADHLHVCMLLSGTIDGDWMRLRPGDVGICSLDAEWRHRSSTGALITFAVPRAVAADAGLDARALHGVRIGSEPAGLLRSHLFQIRTSANAVAPDAGPRLAGTITDLLAVTLAGQGHAVAARPHAVALAVRTRAERLIAAAVEQPGLDAMWLCRQLAVSRATLYRLFEPDGGVQRYIGHVRLEAARRALVGPGDRIADVAHRFGFSDAAHFSRAFRGRFGSNPRDYRARAFASPPDRDAGSRN